MKSPRLLLLAAIVLPALLVCGCGKDEPLRNYTTDPTTRPVVFETPPGWHRVRARQFEQYAWTTFDARGDSARISVSYLPSDDPKGLLPNINRWRVLQLKLPEITEAEMELDLKKIDVDGHTLRYAELIGPEDAKRREAIWGAIFIAKKKTWFLKFKGPVALAQQQKGTFEEWMPDAFRAIMSAVREPTKKDTEESSDGY